jgi:DNA-binding IclR family transcriptional regulator
MKRRQKEILAALRRLGGEATTRQIAEKTGLHVNGVAQSLVALADEVEVLGGRGGETRWRLKA